MQATIHRYDPATGAGSVVTDAGLVIPLAAGVVAAGGLRHVRVGQRLTVSVTGEGAEAVVTSVRLESVGQVPPPAAP